MTAVLVPPGRVAVGMRGKHLGEKWDRASEATRLVPAGRDDSLLFLWGAMRDTEGRELAPTNRATMFKVDSRKDTSASKTRDEDRWSDGCPPGSRVTADRATR